MAGPGESEHFWQENNWKIILVLSIVTLFTVYYLVNKSKKHNYPPSHGWIPFIGCAVEFGKDPLHFINWATQKVFMFLFTFQD